MNMMSYQTANFGAVGENVTASQARIQMNDEESESGRKMLQNRVDSRLSGIDNESQVNGMGVTVGENLGKLHVVEEVDKLSNIADQKDKEEKLDETEQNE